MEILMDILRGIAAIRTPILDFFFSAITYVGDEIFFLAFAMTVFWCVNKREGYYVLFVGLFGTVANQFLKLLCRIPRPWVIDPVFKPIDSAIEAASGYSFPSGHTQNVAGTLGAFAAYNRKKVITVISISLIVLVAFSRMYLGVHTLLDIAVSLVFGLALVLLLRPVFSSDERFRRFMPYLAGLGIVLCIGFTVYVHAVSSDSELDPHNLHSAMKNAYTLIGCLAGLFPVYLVDTKFTKFDTRAKWYVQVIKLALGFGIVLLIKSGLSAPLVALFGNEFIARAVRYFLIVVFAGMLWPMCFKYLCRINIPALDFKNKT